jgi:signal transduction histidine kinase
MILSASESLSRLVDNVLDVALVEAGRLELELVDVGLSDLVAEAIGMAQTKARDSDVALKRDVAANAGVIRADGKRLKQALVSLISNALRFTPSGGAVIVGAQRMEGAVRLWVSDTGAGVPYDQQVQAFDQFTSGDRRGAGLGLALVRSFVELHHGWLGLQSDPGAGTTVNIFLPLEAGDGARNAA